MESKKARKQESKKARKQYPSNQRISLLISSVPVKDLKPTEQERRDENVSP